MPSMPRTRTSTRSSPGPPATRICGAS
jgi:hypothetical protein